MISTTTPKIEGRNSRIQRNSIREVVSGIDFIKDFAAGIKLLLWKIKVLRRS